MKSRITFCFCVCLGKTFVCCLPWAGTDYSSLLQTSTVAVAPELTFIFPTADWNGEKESDLLKCTVHVCTDNLKKLTTEIVTHISGIMDDM